jgi:tRNA(Ile)-lysidine synthase
VQAAAEAADQPSFPDEARSAIDALPENCLLLTCVSGGSDSLALLHMVRSLRPNGNIRVVTVDHQLRSASADEAEIVKRLCASHGLPHHTLRWKGHKPASGLIAAAREARYGLVHDLALKLNTETGMQPVILTGHTLDDQLETLRMRAERLAPQSWVEAPGMSGMAEKVFFRDVPIVRPLLKCRRQALRHWLVASHYGPWIDDPTNEDHSYERPRVRSAAVSSESERRLLAHAAVAERFRRRVTQEAVAYCQEHVQQVLPLVFRLERSSFNMLPQVVQRAVLGRLGAIASGADRFFSGQSFAICAENVSVGTGATFGGARFDCRRKAEIWIYKEDRNFRRSSDSVSAPLDVVTSHNPPRKALQIQRQNACRYPCLELWRRPEDQALKFWLETGLAQLQF